MPRSRTWCPAMAPSSWPTSRAACTRRLSACSFRLLLQILPDELWRWLVEGQVMVAADDGPQLERAVRAAWIASDARLVAGKATFQADRVAAYRLHRATEPRRPVAHRLFRRGVLGQAGVVEQVSAGVSHDR